jgi:thiamine biosynthesis protein ThiS
MICINNKDILWKEGVTLAELIKKNNFQESTIVVSVDGKMINRKEFISFKVMDESKINIIHICHGG